MSLNVKITIVFLLLLIFSPFLVYRAYQNSRPKYEPPKPREEITITIIPGWNIRDIAKYLVDKGVASSTKDVYLLTGEAAKNKTETYNFTNKFLESKPKSVSLEGYIAPETYRIFKDAKPEEVLKKFIDHREKQLLNASSTRKTLHEILTMASIVEDEARTEVDRKMVADILWRRLEKGWALQVDSSVHYIVDRTGDVFTTEKERDIDSPWNTYKYPGLPPGPISNPSLESIDAANNPERNSYWYFLTGKDGKMHYAKTLDEHNLNRYKYL